MTPIKQTEVQEKEGNFGIEVNMNDVAEWNPTVPMVRDAIFDWRIVAPDFTLVMPVLPQAHEYKPTSAEVSMTTQLAQEAVTAGRMIDFGTLPNSVLKIGGNRGGPMWNLGALGQPFTAPWVLYHSWEGGVCVYLVNPIDEHQLEICELQPAIISGIRTLMIHDRGLFIREEGIDIKKYNHSLAPATERFVLDEQMRSQINNGGSPHAAASSNIGDPVMTALLILNTRNIGRQTIAVSDKLQKARQKNGKPPIPPFDRINSNPYVTAILARGQHRERGDSQGGTHATPIPHLRMGHPRRYATGRSIFVQDTLVNVSEEQRETFKATRSHYTVR